MDTFAKKFLSKGKFIGGNKMSVADYKIGTWVWYLEHPTVHKNIGYKNPARLSQFATDFLAALSPESRQYLEGGKGFLDSLAK